MNCFWKLITSNVAYVTTNTGDLKKCRTQDLLYDFTFMSLIVIVAIKYVIYGEFKPNLILLLLNDENWAEFLFWTLIKVQ